MALISRLLGWFQAAQYFQYLPFFCLPALSPPASFSQLRAGPLRNPHRYSPPSPLIRRPTRDMNTQTYCCSYPCWPQAETEQCLSLTYFVFLSAPERPNCSSACSAVVALLLPMKISRCCPSSAPAPSIFATNLQFHSFQCGYHCRESYGRRQQVLEVGLVQARQYWKRSNAALPDLCGKQKKSGDWQQFVQARDQAPHASGIISPQMVLPSFKSNYNNARPKSPCKCQLSVPPSLNPLQLPYNQLHFYMLASSSFWKKAAAFLLTFLGYASLHSLREGWSYSKEQLEREFQVDSEFLGIVDALYLISYSFGMAALGSIIHRVSLKTYIIVGLLLASFSYMLFPIIFAITGYFSPALMAVLMCFNGFFQATGWPGMMGIFGNWFQKNKKGVLMGVWAMNANVGNIIASSLCNVLEEHQLSWVWNFAVTGGFAVAVAVLMLFLLKEKPEENQHIGSQIEGSMLTEGDRQVLNESATREQQNIAGNQPALKYGIFSVLCLPRVPLYVLGYSCLKGCIYGLLFWLPIFFAKKGGDIESQKGYIASMIDLGSLIGGTAVGFLVDHYNKRALFLSPLLLFSSIIMFIVSFALTNIAWQYYVAMFLIGNCIGGPYNIIGTVIAIDIGNNIKEKGSITKVSSLIEGSAAFFTAISMIFIPRIPFQLIFYLFSAECIIATLALSPLFIQEVQAVRAARQKQHLLQETQE